MKAFSFSTATTIVNEPGASSRLGELVRGIHRVLIVTDKGVKRAGLLEPALESLRVARIETVLFSEVVADPPESVVENALHLARAADIDGVIGFGGGSSMDVAKLVALLTDSPQTLADVYGIGMAEGKRLPLVLVPTTAGTGSEVTPISVVTTGATTKLAVVAPQLLPDIALLDADLTLGLPPFVTASTGIDAMVHAIEAYTTRHKKNPYSDMLAREALRLLSANIVRAVRDGSDREARAAMLYGAMLAGQAFANAPVAAVHALAYPLGGHYHIAHGLSNSLVLPEVLKFNLSIAESHYAELSEVIAPDKPRSGGSLIIRIIELIQAVGLPATLREANVPEADLPMLARDAMLQQRLLINNPCDVTEADALAIYTAAYG